ncbi:MAG: aminotransferase class V-fold PLP-dependent enzyme [Candidatus Eisenbacteria bacterium]|uniref:Aminotransferase class V-fold PLP-dependent enzyme n=1 Tax=Eiseniibacteriota bacterium TaxID=2212470 RepID=A0A538UBE2_UNCEI|nr:MAG: aminotransferase class V-fold PLP-dependent enzyme [Candidatus Eisenbacteria bacterium]
MTTRRDFIASAAAATAAVLTPGRLLAALEKQTAPLPDLSRWSAVRAQFALSKEHLQFASFYLVSHPKPVRDSIEDFRRVLDADPFLTVEHRMFEQADNIQYKIRDDLSGYLGAKREEIAITGNTTTGLALVYNGLPLRSGDEVLTTTHDHYSHHESIRFAVERVGATMRRVPLFERPATATVEEMTGKLRAAIRPRTRVVGLTWVHSSTGMRLPIPALAQVVREANRSRREKDAIVVVVDGVHGIGAVDATVAALGADFFCAGTHKWMFAPRGTGIVWAKADRWAMLRPTIPTFANMEAFNAWMNGDTTPRPTTAYDVTPGGFHAYEHQWAMSAAFRFHEKIGRARLAARIRELNDRCKEGLAAMKNVTLHTPRDPELSAGICCFEVNRVSPEEIVKRLLDRRIVASTSPYKITYARLAPSLVNTPEEVDRALQAVREIAGA